MHQTTYGVTHKISDSKLVIDFLNENKEILLSLCDKKDCLYEKSRKLIKNPVLNYLNLIPDRKVYKQLKALIKREFDNCEKIYPFLGDLFVLSFFDLIDIESLKEYETFRYHKDDESCFLNNIYNKNIKNVIKWILDNCSMERMITIESTDSNQIYIEKYNDIIFKFDYDYDFLGKNKSYTVKNYNFILIDGFIESVGEIHHLLFEANKNKEPYVIFCYNMAQEVKNTIIKNNSLGKTEIMPVIIDFNENTANILNDIAVIHDTDIITALKGQTISQEVTKKILSKGPKITFYQGSLAIEPIAKMEKIKIHRSFLQKRVNTASNDINVDIINERIKNMSTKNLKIFLPKEALRENYFSRELDYALNFLSKIDKKMITIKNIFDHNYFVPIFYIDIVVEKINSLKNIYNNLDRIILNKEGK